jgi:hypothetical protein
MGLQMTDVKRRLSDIEDRKIEILMELGDINREYDLRSTALREEYVELDAEHYRLKLLRIRDGGSRCSRRGDGEP